MSLFFRIALVFFLAVSPTVSWSCSYDADLNASNHKVIDLELQNQYYDDAPNLCYSGRQCINNYSQKKAREGSFLAFEAVLFATKGVVANGRRGRASEARVLDDLGLPKNNTKVSTAEGNSIPDALTSTKSIEIKDCISVSCTGQIRIQAQAARNSGRESILVTGKNTNVNQNTRDAFDRIIRRDDLGPQ